MSTGIKYNGPYDQRVVNKRDLGDDAPEDFSKLTIQRGEVVEVSPEVIKLLTDEVKFGKDFSEAELEESEPAGELLDDQAPEVATKAAAKAGKSKSTSTGTGEQGTVSGSTGTSTAGGDTSGTTSGTSTR